MPLFFCAGDFNIRLLIAAVSCRHGDKIEEMVCWDDLTYKKLTRETEQKGPAKIKSDLTAASCGV